MTLEAQGRRHRHRDRVATPVRWLMLAICLLLGDDLDSLFNNWDECRVGKLGN